MKLEVLLLKLSEGMLVSVEIFTLTLLFSLPLGLFVAFGRMSKNPLLRNIIKIYISIMRGTPLSAVDGCLFQPYYIFGLPTPHRFLAVIVDLSNYAHILRVYYGISPCPWAREPPKSIIRHRRL